MSEAALIIHQEPARMPAPITPMDMLTQAVERGASIEVMTKLMDLRDRWEASQARKEFDAAVADAKAEIPTIAKNRKGHNDKRYADFAAIASVVDPIISKHGLSYRFRTTQTDRINVTCILSHKAGHFEETTLSGPADATGNKNAIQAIGSTLTYLQRYTLVQALGLSAAEDDDGKSAGSAETISEEDVDHLNSRIAKVGANIDLFLKHFKIECVPDLPASRLVDANRMLDAKERQKGAN